MVAHYTQIMDKKMHMQLIAWVLIAPLLLAGCASNVPLPVRTGLADQVNLAEVRTDPERYRTAPVRWGGEIITIENKAQETWVELLAHPLDSEGRPLIYGASEGRFLGRIAGFLDPAVYTAERELTVTGWVEGQVIRKVGEYPYTYPLVNVRVHYLWPQRRPIRHPRYDPWYDPFYDPWYPYYRHPFYRYPHYPYPWW